MVKHLAARQVAWGADVLDVNVGVPGLDEIQHDRCGCQGRS